jgi:hypothetical protein
MVTNVESAIAARIVDANTDAVALAIVRQFIEDCVAQETTESEREPWLRAVLKGLNDRRRSSAWLIGSGGSGTP